MILEFFYLNFEDLLLKKKKNSKIKSFPTLPHQLKSSHSPGALWLLSPSLREDLPWLSFQLGANVTSFCSRWAPTLCSRSRVYTPHSGKGLGMISRRCFTPGLMPTFPPINWRFRVICFAPDSRSQRGPLEIYNSPFKPTFFLFFEWILLLN